MAEKDVLEKTLEEYNDVFADIVNGLLFDGEPVVSEMALIDAERVTAYKADGGLHEQERDVAKYWVFATDKQTMVRIAFLGLENQTAYDQDMPLRVIGYDGAAYRAQLNGKDRYPVVTLVLYFGSRPWGKNRSLYEALEIPERIKPYVSDYRINVFEIARLTDEQIDHFHSDFRIVADYFTHSREDPSYRPKNEAKFRHVDEMLKFLSVLTQDERFYRSLTLPQERRPSDMDKVLDYWIGQGEMKGREEGRAEGVLNTIVASVKNLMNNTQWTAQQAMTALGIPDSEQEKYAALL